MRLIGVGRWGKSGGGRCDHGRGAQGAKRQQQDRFQAMSASARISGYEPQAEALGLLRNGDPRVGLSALVALANCPTRQTDGRAESMAVALPPMRRRDLLAAGP